MEKTKKELNPTERLLLRKHNPNYTPPPQQVILTISDVTVGCLQSFVVFSGIPKSGKSTYMAATTGSAFSDSDIFKIKLHLPHDRDRIAYFDTESSEFDFYRQIDRVVELAQLDTYPDTLDAFCTREDSPEQVVEMINTYLKNTPTCSVLIIDGILDLLHDYNNITESSNLIKWIKRLTKLYNILVIGVLHIGKKGENTLGHVGSMADRLVQSSVRIERNKEQGTFDMTPVFLRSAFDFDPISIRNTNGKWFLSSYEAQEQPKKRNYSDYTELEHKRLISAIVPTRGLQYGDLIRDIQEHEAIGVNKAKELVKLWIKNKYVVKDHEGNYRELRKV